MLLTYRYSLLAVVTVSVMLAVAGCGNKPVATVGGVKITESELNERLMQAAGSNILRSMIDRQLLREAAEEKGIEITEEEMAQEIEEAKAQYGGEEGFQQYLAENDISQEQWENDLKVMVLARELALHDVNPTEEDLREFFEQNKDRFRRPATVSLSEIMVASKEDADQVMKDLESGEASFTDLVSRYSLSTTRETGGERPEMPIDAINQEQVKEIATTVPVGEVGGPVQIDANWYMFKVRDRQAAREASFETDRERVEEQYEMMNANDLSAILDEQKKKTTVNIVDPRFQQLNAEYAGMPDEIPQFGTEGAQGGTMPMEGHEGHDHGPLPEAPATPDSE